jgi:hypothetical protein
VNQRYLPTYLNDHLAGAVAMTKLAGRAASSNAGTGYGDFLEELHHEIAEDRATLELIMDRLEVRKDTIKTTAAQVAERLGRLKPNAHVLTYSPLSRLEELEILALGVSAKLALWRSLRRVTATDDRVELEVLETLVERAERQREGLETRRLRAAEDALA